METVHETYKNLKQFVGSDYTNSVWYSTLQDDFNENDQGGKGYLTREEIDATIEEYFNLKGIDPTIELKDDYFNKIDSGAKGNISFDDLYQFAKQAVEMDFLPELEEQCRQYDIDVWKV